MAWTIEERAKDYATQKVEKDFCSNGVLFLTNKYKAYVYIASEQKQIDFQNACLNFCKVCGVKDCQNWENCDRYKKFRDLMIKS